MTAPEESQPGFAKRSPKRILPRPRKDFNLKDAMEKTNRQYAGTLARLAKVEAEERKGNRINLSSEERILLDRLLRDSIRKSPQD